jgi:hypothetical protein
VVEARLADRRELVRAEGRVFGLEVADGLADSRRQAAVLLDLGGREEAGHALSIEARRPPVDGPLGDASLPGALAGGTAEEHDRAQQLVGALLREGCQQLQLLPVVSGLDARASHGRHGERLPSLSGGARPRALAERTAVVRPSLAANRHDAGLADRLGGHPGVAWRA